MTETPVLTHARCPYTARAWWADQLLAESAGTVRVDQPGRAPTLWFPLADVRLDRLPANGLPRLIEAPPGLAAVADMASFDDEHCASSRSTR